MVAVLGRNANDLALQHGALLLEGHPLEVQGPAAVPVLRVIQLQWTLHFNKGQLDNVGKKRLLLVCPVKNVSLSSSM